MVSKSQLLKLLPPFNNRQQVVKYKQSTNDIVKYIVIAHERFETDYDKIYQMFDTGNDYSTGGGIWDFCKYRLTYLAEPEDDQTVRSPTSILQPGATVDCKHCSLFIGGILDAIKNNEDVDWNWCYRFVSYDKDPHVSHVFCVINPGTNKEIWVDPVLDYYNEKKAPTYYVDRKIKPMLSIISGIGAGPQTTEKTVTVDSAAAEQDFLVWVTLDLFGIRTLLKQYPEILTTKVKTYFVQHGFDYNNLVRILNTAGQNG